MALGFEAFKKRRHNCDNEFTLVLLGGSSYTDKMASNTKATGRKCLWDLGNYFRPVALAEGSNQTGSKHYAWTLFG